MSDLLETAIEAHGGLERWNQLDNVSARLIQDGYRGALRLRLRRGRGHQAPHQAQDLPAHPRRPIARRAPLRLDRSQRNRIHLTRDDVSQRQIAQCRNLVVRCRRLGPDPHRQ
jgi:hypothetical protein